MLDKFRRANARLTLLKMEESQIDDKYKIAIPRTEEMILLFDNLLSLENMCSDSIYTLFSEMNERSGNNVAKWKRVLACMFVEYVLEGKVDISN